MASQESITILLDTIKGHWPVFSRNNPNVVRDWSSVCKHLSESQVKAGSGRMVRIYKGDRPPTPAMFVGWAGGVENPTDAPPIHFKRYFKVVRGLVIESVRIVQGEAPPRPHTPKPSRETAAVYWGCVGLIWTGEAQLPNTPEENMRIIQCDDPLDPEVLALRNHNRKALGWPPLNTQGRPVSNA